MSLPFWALVCWLFLGFGSIRFDSIRSFVLVGEWEGKEREAKFLTVAEEERKEREREREKRKAVKQSGPREAFNKGTQTSQKYIQTENVRMCWRR